MENVEYEVLLEQFKKILRVNGLKYTKQRESLLQILYNSDEHLTPDEISELLKERENEQNVGIATIYRTLKLLEDAGMVTSISFGTSGSKFELANKPHHDHMICKSCGKIVEFQDEIIESRQIKIAKEHKFKLSNHLMQLYGTCEACCEKKQK